MEQPSITTYFTDNEALLEAVKSCDDLDTLRKIADESADRFDRLQTKQRREYLPELVASIHNFIDRYGNFDIMISYETDVSLLEVADALENYAS